ncbi:MAG: hypothetical protein RL571_3390 [Pseudomonadota bacterium]|jgi:cytochrome c
MNLLGKTALFFSFSLLASHSFAADGMALALKNNGLACHSVDTKIVGPSFKEVALKYKGNAGAANMLMQNLSSGASR